MEHFTGQLLVTIYEHQLRHRRPRHDALVEFCRWANDHANDGLLFAALLSYAANNSSTCDVLLDAGRAGLGDLLDALSGVDVQAWDEALAAAYDDPNHTMTPGWMAHVAAEMTGANDAN